MGVQCCLWSNRLAVWFYLKEIICIIKRLRTGATGKVPMTPEYAMGFWQYNI